MTQTVQIDEDVVELDSEVTYFLTENPEREEKLFRKALSLPVKKPIVYYKDKHDVKSAVKVLSVRLLEMYDVTKRWYTCEIHLCDSTTVVIHSWYLADMQSPDFVFEVDMI